MENKPLYNGFNDGLHASSGIGGREPLYTKTIKSISNMKMENNLIYLNGEYRLLCDFEDGKTYMNHNEETVGIIASTNKELNLPLLLLSNIEEVIGVVDVERLARENANGFTGTNRGISVCSYIDGFNKNAELNKHKMFTLEQMERSLITLMLEITCDHAKLNGKSQEEISKWIDDHMKRLTKPQTSWSVEAIKEGDTYIIKKLIK